MLPIPAFNPGDTTKYPNGNGVIQVGAADAGSKMLLYNESPFNINIDFLNGSQSILHAWEARYWTLDGDTRQVEWDINSTLNVTSSPISLVIGELYGPSDKLEGTYPMGLIRQTNVGNPGGVVSSASQVINDGQTLQGVVEATLQGHTSSDVLINNDGTMLLKGGKIGKTAIGDTIDASDGTNLHLTSPATSATGKVEVGSSDRSYFTFSDEVFGGIHYSEIHSSSEWLLFDGAGNDFLATSAGEIDFRGANVHFQTQFNADIFTFVTTLVHIFTALQVDGACTLAAAGLLTHILGTLTVDQVATFTANIIANASLLTNTIRDNVNGNVAFDLSAGTGAVTLGGKITGPAAANLILNAVATKQVEADINNVKVFTVDAGGLNFSSKKLFDTSANNLADWTGGGLFLKGNNANQSGMSYQGNGTNSDFKLSCLSNFSGTGTVTVNHSMTQFGASIGPDLVVPVVQVSGSATMGYDSITSTQVHITAGASLSWHAWGFR